MSASAIIAIAIIVLVLLAAVLFVTNVRRRDTRRAEGVLSRETRAADKSGSTPEPLSGRAYEKAAVEPVVPSTDLVPVGAAPLPAPYVPPDPEELGVTRRQFMNRSSVALMGLGITGFGAAAVAFLWPKLGGGFGSKITVGKVEEVKAAIQAGDNFFYLAEGRAWLTEYPAEAMPKAEKVYSPPVLSGMAAGIVALYQKCPHLGCRVPDCKSSQWFECPCHGSQYNRAGEKKFGPAPRGMDRFGVSVAGGLVTIDTATVIPGPPIGTNTTGQEAEGPHCITGGEGGH